VLKAADEAYEGKVNAVGRETFAGFERSIMLQAIDQHWREHLAALDYLRQGIHLRGYAQKNPKQEYKREAFELFGLMQARVRNDVTRVLMTVRIQSPEEAQQAEETIEQKQAQNYGNVSYTHADFDEAAASAEGADAESIALALQQVPAGEPQPAQPMRRFGSKIGRNDPCPCGSGKKYKQCHGQLG
jgi:preprotein translocase subunit SecA